MSKRRDRYFNQDDVVEHRTKISSNSNDTTIASDKSDSRIDSSFDGVSPHQFLIIGDGRLARHLHRFFDLKSIRYTQWRRQDGVLKLEILARQATRVLLAISDRSIEVVAKQIYTINPKPMFVHFSGALSFSRIESAHPLFAFSDRPLSLADYENITFTTELGRASLREMLPGLGNFETAIASETKPLYHALCVLSGNGSTALWEKTIALFKDQFNIPNKNLESYLGSIFSNLAWGVAQNKSVLTGPWVRGDLATISKNLNSLHELSRIEISSEASDALEKFDISAIKSKVDDCKPISDVDTSLEQAYLALQGIVPGPRSAYSNSDDKIDLTTAQNICEDDDLTQTAVSQSSITFRNQKADLESPDKEVSI
jgi:2-dehydropantoate 2-reductase